MPSALAQVYADIRNRILSISDLNYSLSATGSGNATFSGTYCGGQINDTFNIIVTGAGLTFDFTAFGISGTDIAITAGSPQYLGSGIYIVFLSSTNNDGETYQLNVASQPLIKFCQMYNDQLSTYSEGENKSYAFPFPAVFIEIVNELQIEQLGDDVQLYNDLIVRLHIAHEFYNANPSDGFGMTETDMKIFDIRNQVYKAIQKFEPTNAVAMVRISEQPSYVHKMVYAFMQDYRTNIIDLETPAFGNDVTVNPPISADINVSFNPSPFIK